MYFLRAAAASLLLTQASEAWLLQFASTTSCSPQDQVEEKGGLTGKGNECMELFLTSAAAMTITDWDPLCRVVLWGQDASGCRPPEGAEPLLNVTLAEAKEQKEALFDTASKKVCYRNLRKAPAAASFICPKDKDSKSPDQGNKPEEKKPEEQKPDEQKPDEQKPDEQKPTEQKPTEQNPEDKQKDLGFEESHDVNPPLEDRPKLSKGSKPGKQGPDLPRVTQIDSGGW